MVRLGRWGLWCLVAAASAAPDAAAVVVAPHAVFLDHQRQSAVMYVQNPGDRPVEFSVSLKFGYPMSTGDGGIKVAFIDDAPPAAPSAARFVRALPAKGVVQPAARQAVRLLAQPPAGLPDGEYWSRIVVESREAGSPSPVGSGADDVKIGLSLEMRTVTSLTYRNGRVSTGVTLEELAARYTADSLHVDVRLDRRGNGAYLGKLEFSLADATGAVVGEWQQAVAAYAPLYRRLQFPAGPVAAGPLTLRLRLSTDREDIPSQHVLPCPPVERSCRVVVD